MKKNILIITDSYPPEIRSAAQLMKDLADGLHRKGHNVWVATSYPKYNLVNSGSSVWPRIKDENGIKVLRIKTLPHHKVNFFVRGIAQLLMPNIFLREIKQTIKEKIDIAIVHSPPLPLTIVASKVKKFYKAKYILNLHDIFPQNAIDLGALKNKLIIKFFEKMERRAYQDSDLIVVPSKSHKRFLEEKRTVSKQKIQVISHWIDINPFLKAKKTNKFRKLYNLENKLIFLFGGVLGPSQGLDLLIKVADRIKDNKDIVFLLVGDGSAKEGLIRMTKQLKLNNVLFKDFVSLEEYPELVKDCDIGIICLTEKNTTPAVPAKILGYMAASIPVIAFLHKESDGCEIVQEAKCGYAVRAGDLDKAVEVIRNIYKEKDKLEELGSNGFQYTSNNLTADVCVNKLEELF